MSILRMGISDIRELNHMIAPGLNLGVKSVVAVNGHTDFNISTYAYGADGDIIQYQYCGESSDVYCRVYNSRTTLFSPWTDRIGELKTLQQTEHVYQNPDWNTLFTRNGYFVFADDVRGENRPDGLPVPAGEEVIYYNVVSAGKNSISGHDYPTLIIQRQRTLEVYFVNMADDNLVTATRLVDASELETAIQAINDMITEIDNDAVGKSVFDEITGKPVWLKTINDYVKGVYTVTFGDTNVKHRFSITVTGVATTSGTIAIRVDTNADIEVEVLDTDTVEDINYKIKAAIDLTGDWKTLLSLEGALVCEKVVASVVPVTQFVDTDHTHVTATIDILNEGAETASGNITLTVDGDDIVIPVDPGDSAEDIGFMLQTIGIVDWTVACSAAPNGEVVTLSCRFAGDHTITFEDTDSTGITAVIATVTEGSASVWVYADGSASGYLPEEYRAS